MPYQLAPDETEVPTKLAERQPLFPFPFPFDWTARQTFGFVLCVWAGFEQLHSTLGTEPERLKLCVLLVSTGVLLVILDYACKPSPEYWISLLVHFGCAQLAALPIRLWRHFLRGKAKNMGLPAAILPVWLTNRLFGRIVVRDDDLIELRSWRPRSKPQYRSIIQLEPRANPDLLPMNRRAALIAQRTAILRSIRGHWALTLQVRPVLARTIELAAGPAWAWYRSARTQENERDPIPLGQLILRRPLLIIKNDDAEKLKRSTFAVLHTLHMANMRAEPLYEDDLAGLIGELWGEGGAGGFWAGRWRIARNRLMAGRRLYQSYLVTELPRVINLAWLRPLTSWTLLADITIDVETRRRSITKRSLERRITRWHAARGDREYALALGDAENMLLTMDRNEDEEIRACMTVTAPEAQAAAISEALDRTLCEFEPARFAQAQARLDSLPIGWRGLNRAMPINVRSVATTDLLATAGYWPEGATLIGRGLYAPEPVGINLIDPMNLNWSMFLTVMQGGGKTTAISELLWRMANPHPEHPLHARPVKIVSIDFKATRDIKPLFDELEKAGHRATYNGWTNGPLPDLEDGHFGFNLSDVKREERGKRMLELGERVREWAATHSLEQTMLLFLDEALFTAELPEGGEFIAELGSQGRSLNIALIVATQHIVPMLLHEKARLAFQNASHAYYGRQNDLGVAAMRDAGVLDPVAEQELLNAPDGAGLLHIERRDGPIMLAIQWEPTPWELATFGTNPAERLARFQRDLAAHQAAGTTFPNGVYGHGSAFLEETHHAQARR